MTSLQGSIIVTGANGGLGTCIVQHILKRSDLTSKYMGVYTVRKAASATALKKTLANAPRSHKHEITDLDLGSLASVRKVAGNINKKVAAGEMPPIRALILNAAYQDATEMHMTGDGFEMTWQVNFLANMLLSLMLLQSMDKQSGRILILGSWSHDVDDERNKAGGNDPYKNYTTIFPGPEALAKGEWNSPKAEGGWYTGYRRYGASKLCAVILMHELADRLAHDPELSNISVMSMDPGAMASGLVRRGNFTLSVLSTKVVLPLVTPITVKLNPNGILRTPSKSASDVIRACFDIDPPKEKALYLNGSEERQTSREARDPGNRKALWGYGLQAASIQQADTTLKDWQ